MRYKLQCSYNGPVKAPRREGPAPALQWRDWSIKVVLRHFELCKKSSQITTIFLDNMKAFLKKIILEDNPHNPGGD